LYAAAGLGNRRQLLYHLPARYRLRPAARPLEAWLAAEQAAEGAPRGVRPVAVSGRVTRTSLRRRGRHSTVSVVLACDGGGSLTVLLFNRAYLAKSLRGGRLWAAGRLSVPDDGPPRLLASDYERLPAREDAGDDGAPEPALPPLPIYRLPAGIPPRVHRKVLAAILVDGPVADWRDAQPGLTDASDELPSLDAALRAIHLPGDLDAAREARRRLAHDEAFALSLDVAARRRKGATRSVGALPLDDVAHLSLLARLPHVPTAAQERALGEIRRDLGELVGGRPMARLLQGDVGSGKTLVAFYALLAAAAAGRQAALMAPTEILAAQHLRALRALLARAYGDEAPRVAFLVAGAPRAERQALATGEARLAVGTHALQSARLVFQDLAVTVVDEQHRFGVRQRSRFREKGEATHLLVMTATPIPRTLALTAYGELDVSVIDELPPGRAPRTTRLVERAEQPAMWRTLRSAVAAGERGYVVCPSIGTPRAGVAGADEDEEPAGHSVSQTLRRVRRHLGASVRVDSVHGRMPAAERDAVLEAFRAGDVDVLVATVLVEVGLDVPEATFVVLPDPSRFGLAQMHQIRGRVGRGGRAGRCLLLGPLPEGPARARAEALVASEDGFLLAEQDLRLRGPGELLGTAQSGMPDFCALDPVRDVALLAATRESALAAAAECSDRALARMRAAVFPVMERRGENLLLGG
jgi:ATP-dependent DNA helicase RecG